MNVKYETQVIGEGNHASLLIPQWILEKLQTNKRVPLRITINGHTYRSTAVGVGGECRVVFPSADRLAAKAAAGDLVQVSLQLDSGYREVDVSMELAKALESNGLTATFSALSYSKRKEFARQIAEAKTEETKIQRIQKFLESIRN